MIAQNVHQALAQVREIQSLILERQRFKGYSGQSRAVGGAAALAGAAIMSLPIFPATTSAHFTGWACVAAFAMALNFGSLALWYGELPPTQRDPRKLEPGLGIFPPLFVGAILTLGLAIRGHYDCLFGAWMCLFGLSNLSASHVMPARHRIVGYFYLICGTGCFLSPGIDFLRPLPMGSVFFVGELTGGYILHRLRMPDATVGDLFNFSKGAPR
jgi:hypothetical protein